MAPKLHNHWPREVIRATRGLRISLEPSFDPSVHLLFWEVVDQTFVRVVISGYADVTHQQVKAPAMVSKMSYDELTSDLLLAAGRTKDVIALDGISADIAWRGAAKVHDLRFDQVVATTPLANVLVMAVDAALEALKLRPCIDALNAVRGYMSNKS